MNPTAALMMLQGGSNATPAQKTAPNQGLKQNENGLFQGMLAQALTGEATNSQQAASQDVDLLPMFPIGDGAEAGDVLSVFAELFKALPNEDAFFSDEMVSEEMKELIQLLPKEAQEEILAILQSNLPIEAIFADDQAVSPAAQFVTSLLVSSYLEQEGKLPRQALGEQQLQQFFAQFKQIFGLEQRFAQQLNTQQLSFKEFLEQVVSQWKQNNQANSQGAPSTAGKLELPHSVLDRVKQLAAEIDQLRANTQNVGKPVFETQAPLDRLQQYTIHLSHSNQETSGAKGMQQQFIEQFQQILRNSKFINRPGGMQQLVIRLQPENLGSLSVKLSQLNGEMIARIAVSTQAAKELVESNLHQLRYMLTSQTIPLEKVDVVLQSEQQLQQSLKEQQRDTNEHKEQQEQQQEEQHEDEQKRSFQEELLNVSV